MKKTIKILVIINLLLAIFYKLQIFAESGTYADVSGCFIVGTYSSGQLNMSASLNVRGVVIKDSSGYYYPRILSNSSFTYGIMWNSCPASNNNQSDTLSGYYIGSGPSQRNVVTNWPVFDQISGKSVDMTALYFTFGEGAVEPEPVYSFGQLRNVGYNTKIAGSGNAAVNNVDVIKWGNVTDTNGNNFALLGVDAFVDIKAVSSNYTATDIQLINALTLNDLTIEQANTANLGQFSFGSGSASFSWADVADALEQNVSDLPPYWNGSDWISKGWVYYVRLNVSDAEYTGEWQLLYTSTSAPPADSTIIYNSNTINQQLINVIQQINESNNTTENWEIQNIEINMQNDDDQTSTDKPWWAYLLEAILQLISTIGEFLSNLIDSLLRLFTFESFEIPDFQQQQQNTIQNTGMFGQTIQFTETVQNSIRGVEYVEPVLSYPGMQLDGVDLIPPVEVNLNELCEQYGFTNVRQTAYIVTDGTIYLSLILMIKRKIMGVLKK